MKGGMTWFARTLWDLVRLPPDVPLAPREPVPPAPRPRATRRAGRRAAASRPTMRDRYDALVVEMNAAHGIRVRKWRRGSSGCAWELHARDGSITRMIEAPRPRGPMSCAVFLHEVGHHAIGFGRYRPRCLEEYHAWRWALEVMRERRLNVTPAVERRVAESLRYALAKARRRGLRRVPEELVPYLETEVRAGG